MSETLHELNRLVAEFNHSQGIIEVPIGLKKESTMTMPSIEPQSPTQGDSEWLKLKSELDEILKEQAGGKWENADPTWVQSRVKRTIELTSILRRTNTGPAKPKSARAKGKRGPSVDLASIKADLLS
jgi:hypothetical protein